MGGSARLTDPFVDFELASFTIDAGKPATNGSQGNGKERSMNRSALFVVTVVLGLGSLPVCAQDLPPSGRLVIASTSRWGDGLSGVVKNLGPGKMCNVVIQANPYVEESPLAQGDSGTTRVVTQDLGPLDANQETSFNLSSVFVKERMPSLTATGSPCP
jgi:hypothetical protein